MSAIAFGDTRLPARFWAKVSRSPNGCWTWVAALNETGYGKFGYGVPSKSVRAHRVAYETLVRPVGDLHLDHVCHNEDETCAGGVTCRHRRCVNPNHLRPSTNKQNILSGKTLAARKAAQTHCIRGHEFTAANTKRISRGSRTCRTCVNDRRRGVCSTRKCRGKYPHALRTCHTAQFRDDCSPEPGRPPIPIYDYPILIETPKGAA